MTELLTQEQIEHMMYTGGIARAKASMEKAEAGGRAHQNPYAKEIFREFVLPIASVIKSDIAVKKAGARQAHVVLLDGLDPEAVAFLAVRHTISKLLSSNPPAHRTLAYGLGLVVHRELVLEQIATQAPELYHTLANDFARRLSKDERHRLTVFKMQAEKAGVDIYEWNIGSREQVGFYLMGLLEQAGLIEFGQEHKKGVKSVEREVFIQPEVVDRIDRIKEYVSVSMPTYGPCVEPPKDWEFGYQGGFHTEKLRRSKPCLVHGSPHAKQLARSKDMPIVFKAVNALQRTAWAINSEMLDAIYAVANSFSTKEIVSLADSPSPARPEWLNEAWTKEVPKEQWPEDKAKQFFAWKRDMAEWHTQRKLLGVRYGRFYAATRAAEFFRNYPAIYFVYFADSRGRLYPLTYGLNPQGSDLSKSLLRFAEGKPLSTPEAVKWFHVQGANKWGFDKATLAERVAWVGEHQDMILSFAENPVDNAGWKDAGDPLQFLAWCFEYRRYHTNPSEFVSHLPISMDGSCNGLQNLSAMFRDEVGGAATNLTNNAVMRDIYGDVAKVATQLLQEYPAADETEQRLKDMWLAHGIERKAVKRTVMTTPYGVTQRTATEYIIDDYLREGLGPTFNKEEYRKAANMLMSVVWPAIGKVVVKGREAMDWLKKSARVIMQHSAKEDDPVITWDVPSGFPATQAYFDVDVHRINTRLHGQLKIRVLSENDNPDKQRHANGMAPNFVHSLDAAHLHLTTAAAADAGITALAMIHDDYGTHAADSEELFHLIRRQFVAMYLAFDPAAEFHKKYPYLSPPPAPGSLDITEVLESDFFFS